MWSLRWPSLSRALQIEADRWGLWLPVWVGLGIAVYFASPVEPELWASGLAALAGFVAWQLWRVGTLGPILMAALAAAALGFGVAALRTHLVAAPTLSIPVKGLEIAGRLETVEARSERGPRLTIAIETFGTWPKAQSPVRVRVSLLKNTDGLRPGQHIRLRADLSPPARPVVPGGYDSARAAYFQQIGAVGFSFQAPEILQASADTRRAGWTFDIVSAVRTDISERIRAALPGQTGAVASALITGERGPIAQSTEDAFRDSGLAHLLVISGLHMAIVTGAAFLFLRSGLSLFPSIALRLATKKWAAVIAALLATAYLLISGGAVATVRAYIMVLVMLVAVLLDRPALALRNVAIAALLILIVRPESLLSAGFQMSFAAVAALIAAYEYFRDRPRRDVQWVNRGRFYRTLMWLGGIGLTTVIASAAVAPIAAYHFQRSQQYALVANIIAGPVMNLWVMPLALVSMLAMPFGLQATPLWLMGLGIDLTKSVATWISGLPGAMLLVPAMPWGAFLAIVAGGIWLIIWRRRWRLWGLVLIAAGLALAPLRTPPDVLVGRDAGIVAVRGSDGSLTALGRRGRWVLERWLIHDGDSRDAGDVMKSGRSACDANSCSIKANGLRVTLTRHPRAFADDCASSDILIVGFVRPAVCPTARLLIDERRVIRRGTHALWFTETGRHSIVRQLSGAPPHRSGVAPKRPDMIAVDDLRGTRPWVATQDVRESQWRLQKTRKPKSPAVAPNAQSASPSIAE